MEPRILAFWSSNSASDSFPSSWSLERICSCSARDLPSTRPFALAAALDREHPVFSSLVDQSLELFGLGDVAVQGLALFARPTR